MLNKLHQFRYVQQIEVNTKEKMTNVEEQKAKHKLCASVAELITSTDIEHYENKPPNLEHIAKLTSALANVHVSDVIRCDLTSANKIEHLLQCMQLALQFTLFSQSILKDQNAMLEQRKVKMSEEVKGQIKKLSEEVNCLKRELNEIRSSNRNLRYKLFDFHTRNTQLEAAYKLLCKQSKAECMSNAKDATMENILEQLTMIAENMHLGICERKPWLSRTERRQEQLEEEEEEIQQLQESKINRHRGAAMKIKGDVTCHNVINTTRDKGNEHERNKQFNRPHNLSHSRYHDFNSHSNATEKCHVETKCHLSDLSRTMNSANEEKIDDDNMAIANHKTHSENKEMTTSKSESELDDKNACTAKKIKNEQVTIAPPSASPVIATPSTEATQPATTRRNRQKNFISIENNNNNNCNVGTSNLERSANKSTTDKDNNNQIELNQMLHFRAKDHVNIKEKHLLHETSNTGNAKEQSGANGNSEIEQQEENKEVSVTATAVPIPTLSQNTSADKPILEEPRHSFTTPMNAVTFPVTHHSAQLLDKGISVFSANSSYDTNSSESEDDNEAAGTVATIRKLQPASSAYKNIYKELAVNINNSLKPDIICYNDNNNDDDDDDDNNNLEPQSQLIK